MKYIILAGGNISEKIKIEYEDKKIICCDRGCEFAISKNLPIELAIGDFDSISKEGLLKLEYMTDKILRLPRDKDMSDLEFALNQINHSEETIILGATGSRLDHTLSNIFLLKKYRKINPVIRDSNNEIRYLDQDIIFSKKKGYISILPTDEKSSISLIGTKWELENFSPEFGSTKTVSNEFVGNVEIKIHKGSIFIFFSCD